MHAMPLAIGRGAAATTHVKDTFLGNNAEGPYNSTSLFTVNVAQDQTCIWVSNPLAADATIAGTVTFNIWANESATQANACITAELVRLNAAGTVQSIIATGVRRAELTTGSVAQNWTRTPTSTTVYAGERIGMRIYIDDGTGVTMAATRTVTITINGPTAAANGDSYVTLTENLTFADDTITATVKSSGGDYTTLSAWETGMQSDLTTNKWIAQAEVYAMQDTTAVTIAPQASGWNTDTTHYIKIYTPLSERHAGKWDATKQRLVVTNAMAIRIDVNDVRLDGLQIQLSSASAANQGGVFFRTARAAGNFRISNCIIRGPGSVAYTDIDGIQAYTAGTFTLNAWNNIIYDFIPITRGGGISIWDSTNTFNVYNNTIQNCLNGMYRSNGTIIAKNNLMRSCTTAASGTFAAGTDYNATDNASMGYTVTGGGNTHDRLSQAFTFTDEAGDDFRITSADAGAKDFGVTDPGSGLFSNDIAGQSRPIGSAWDIGAYEAAEAGAVTAHFLACLGVGG